MFQALAKRSHLSGRGKMHSDVPWFRGGEKQLCLQQEPWGDHMEPDHDFPVGRASPGQPHPWQRAGLVGSWRGLAARSGCSPRLSRMCQMLFAGKGAMLVVPGVALSWHWAGAEPWQLLCGSQPCCPRSLLAHGEGRAAWISAFRSLS